MALSAIESPVETNIQWKENEPRTLPIDIDVDIDVGVDVDESSSFTVSFWITPGARFSRFPRDKKRWKIEEEGKMDGCRRVIPVGPRQNGY